MSTGMKRPRTGGENEVVESINMANVLVLLSRGAGDEAGHTGIHHPGRVFECKTCNRQFPSFQALGGHRASHKRPRPAGEAHAPAPPPRPRAHECAVCGLEFAIGQALGGHMRRHRAVPPVALMEKNSTAAVVATAAATGGGAGGEKRGLQWLDLDLNRPPAENDKDFLTLSFGLGLPMVDCLH